jgi:hypothetical protein
MRLPTILHSNAGVAASHSPSRPFNCDACCAHGAPATLATNVVPNAAQHSNRAATVVLVAVVVVVLEMVVLVTDVVVLVSLVVLAVVVELVLKEQSVKVPSCI